MEEDEVSKKIFDYNLMWLMDRKSIFNKKIDNSIKKYIYNNAYKENETGVLLGSLINNDLSFDLKEALKKETIESNVSKNEQVMKEVLNISKYCVLSSIYRFEQCKPDEFSRPCISFITTKKNSLKLKYLSLQKDYPFEYISIDHDKVKYGRQDSDSLLSSNPSDFYFRFQGNFDKTILNKFRQSKKFKENLTLDKDKSEIKISTLIGKKDFYSNKSINIDSSYNEEEDPERKELDKTIENIEEWKKDKIRKGLWGDKEENIYTREMTKVKNKEEQLSKKKLETYYDIDKNYLNIGTDFYYKKEIFDFFKKQVKKKLDLEIDLDDWTYCIVFSPKWCSSDYNLKNKDENSLSTINSIINYFKERLDYTLKNILLQDINTSVNGKEIDIQLLYYVMKCFESKDVSESFMYSKIGTLEDFENVELGFKKFKDGGYWIKKIIYELGELKETTEGPYDKKNGNDRVRILNNINQLKEAPSAKLYKFEELVCQYDIVKLEYDTNINEYIKEENMWFPYEGTLLFCLIHRMSDVVYFSRENLTKKFLVFHNYAFNYGMRTLTMNNYLIYFDPNNKKSLVKATQLKFLLKDESNYLPENFIWLLDSVLEREEKRGKEPSFIPFPLSTEYESKGSMTYDQMIKIYEVIQNLQCEDKRLETSFSEFKTAYDFGNVESYKNQKDEIKTIIHTGIVMNRDDEKTKSFKIIKNYNDTYELAIKKIRKRFNDTNLVSINEIKNCSGYMNINFKNMKDKRWNFYRLNLVGEDTFFDKEVVLIMLTIFVAKCFGVKKVFIDTRLKPTECENKILIHYYNIYYLGIGNFNKFKELGFQVYNEETYNEVLDRIRNINITEYATEKKINVKIPEDVKNFTVSDFCKSFLEKETCPSNSYLLILNKISEDIEEMINLEIYNDLEKLSFDFIKSYITHEDIE